MGGVVPFGEEALVGDVTGMQGSWRSTDRACVDSGQAIGAIAPDVYHSFTDSLLKFDQLPCCLVKYHSKSRKGSISGHYNVFLRAGILIA